MSEFAKLCWVFVGAGSGGVLRFVIQQVASRRFPDFPYGTLAVNVLGSFMIGIYLGWESGRNEATAWRVMISAGLLGGFTTFSAFSGESIKLFASGARLHAALYVVGTIVLGLLACAVGIKLTEGRFR